MSRAIVLLFVLGAFAAAPAPAQETPPQAAEAIPPHRAVDATDIEWMPGPPVLPPGARIAVLDGNPAAEGLFTIRLQLPAGYKVQPHTHGGAEHVTVLSGRLGIGVGETWDGDRIHYSGPGGYHVMQAGVPHYAMVEEDTVIQVHSVGPWTLTYVNPEDDPSRQPTPSSN